MYAVCRSFCRLDGTKKDFYGLSVSGRQVLVFMPFVCYRPQVELRSAAELGRFSGAGDVVTGLCQMVIATVSMYCFLAARCILALGEAGNFPAAIKVTAEYLKRPCLCYFYL